MEFAITVTGDEALEIITAMRAKAVRLSTQTGYVLHREHQARCEAIADKFDNLIGLSKNLEGV